MASSADIVTVRENTDEMTADTYDDPYIGRLIDAVGVSMASATIWRQKAADYVKLVDVQEAGSSAALGSLQQKALDMVRLYEAEAQSGTGTGDAGANAVVKIIERS